MGIFKHPILLVPLNLHQYSLSMFFTLDRKLPTALAGDSLVKIGQTRELTAIFPVVNQCKIDAFSLCTAKHPTNSHLTAFPVRIWFRKRQSTSIEYILSPPAKRVDVLLIICLFLINGFHIIRWDTQLFQIPHNLLPTCSIIPEELVEVTENISYISLENFSDTRFMDAKKNANTIEKITVLSLGFSEHYIESPKYKTVLTAQ